MRVTKTILFLLPLGIFACSPALQSTTSSSGSYSEDLSAHRPFYENVQEDSTMAEEKQVLSLADFNPEYDITDTLNAVMDSISVLSQQIRYVDGYAVQVYSGNNREAASIARGRAYSVIDDEKPSLFYDSPNFKVHVGQFYSSLEANKTFALLKKEFPNAILVLKKFKIERE